MAFCIAILAADWSSTHFLWAIGTIVMLAGGCVGLAIRYASVRRLLLSAACMLVLGYAYALWTAVYLPADHVSHHLSPTPVTLEGQVLRRAKVGPNRTTLDLSARALTTVETAVVPVSGRVRVTAYDFEPTVEAGDIVRIRHLRLRQPSGFRNPGAFDYGRYLARRGIYATGSLSKNEHIEVVQHSSNVLLERFAQFKSHLADWIAAAMDADEAAITTAMALGVRSALPPQVREAFNASGTVHLLSVSGFHVAAVYGAVFFLLRFLIKQVRFRLLGRVSGGPRPSKLAATSALAVVMGYACLVTLDGLVDLVDPNFPAIRSTIMITTFVFAYLIDRDGDPFNITLLAALLILALDPLALFGIGFQLSFVGVLAIFYAYRFLSPSSMDDTEPNTLPSLCDPTQTLVTGRGGRFHVRQSRDDSSHPVSFRTASPHRPPGQHHRRPLSLDRCAKRDHGIFHDADPPTSRQHSALPDSRDRQIDVWRDPLLCGASLCRAPHRCSLAPDRGAGVRGSPAAAL